MSKSAWFRPAPSAPTGQPAAANYFCPSGKRYSLQTQRCETHIVIDDTNDGGGRSCGFGNPIFPLTASKREVVDLGQALGGLSLQAVYDSHRKVPAVGVDATLAATAAPAFGPMWESSVHRKLVVQGPAGAGQRVLASRGSGLWTSFVVDAAGIYKAAPNVNDRLELLTGGSGWRYFDAAVQSYETYDSQGMLVAIHRSRGGTLALKYSDSATPSSIAPRAGLLTRLEDQNGRWLEFAYEQPANPALEPRIKRMVNAAGQETAFAYDSSGNLSAVTWPDTQRRQFVYDNAAFPWALTGVIDEQNVKTSSFKYDTSGRAIETSKAGDVDRYSVSWGAPPARLVSEQYDAAAVVSRRTHRWQAPQNTTITLPNGQVSNLGVSSVQGTSLLSSQSQPAGAGCAASSSAQVFDANGNATQRDDFTGLRTCYSHDLSRNVETSRVEGLANTQACSAVTPVGAALPSGSRKTSTQWHPDWRLAVKVAEPKRVTTNVYNGQPDPFAGNAVASCAPSTAKLPDGKPIAVLCKTVVQATYDAAGAAGFAAALDNSVPNRVWSYTYDESGRILATRDPLGNTTTNTYYTGTTADYTRGDLEKTSNALGQATRYPKYNQLGRVLQVVDPNGVATDFEYDARQRMKRQASAGEATQYGYTVSGQLRRVTQPDGGYVDYEYDAAQRLKAMQDHLGNRIEYTLDASGRRREERVKDPAGVLKRQVSRVFDALGRAQQVTGE